MENVQTITKGSKTRSRILKAAMDLFNTKGYHATRISEIIEVSGVQKGNLYFYFKSKEELALALIEEARREYMAYLNSHVSGVSGLDKLDNVLAAVFEFHSRKKFIGGCIFGNIALEMGDQNPEFRDAVRGIFDEWVSLLGSLLEEALAGGEINLTLKPEQMARHIVAALEGGIMLARLSKDKGDLLGSIDSIRALVQMGRTTSVWPETPVKERQVGAVDERGV